MFQSVPPRRRCETGAECRGPAFARALLLGPEHRFEGLAGDPEAGAAVVDQIAAPADPDHVLGLGQVIADGAGAAIDEDAFAEREIGQVGDPHVLGDEDLVRGKFKRFREQGAHGGFRRRVAGEPGDARDDAERSAGLQHRLGHVENDLPGALLGGGGEEMAGQGSDGALSDAGAVRIRQPPARGGAARVDAKPQPHESRAFFLPAGPAGSLNNSLLG